MKRTLTIAAVAVAVVIAACVVVYLTVRPLGAEALLARLARGQGNREELIMRLNMIRGDVVPPMIRAVRDTSKPTAFRADVVELLAKRYFRSPEPKVSDLLLAATKDLDPVVRRRAVQSCVIYGDETLHLELLGCIADPDSEVRRQAYLMLGAGTRGDAEQGIWKLMADKAKKKKEEMIRICFEQVEREEDPEMRLLARAVLGREIEIRAGRALQALQRSDVVEAETILQQALELDPANRQAQIRLTRFYFENEEKDKAFDLARKYGALIEVPRLSQAPVIDGDPTDEVWASEGREFDTFYHTTSRWVARKTKGKSKVYLGHRDGKIYIGVIGYEQDLDDLERGYTDRDSDVWSDDCVEICFDPENEAKLYYQFVINTRNALFDQANGDRSENFKCQYKTALFPKRGYWACEFAIDGKDLDDHPIAPGAVWSLNVFRVRIGPASEHGTIWPTFGWTARKELYPLAIFK